jgi:hypothetical protein
LQLHESDDDFDALISASSKTPRDVCPRAELSVFDDDWCMQTLENGPLSQNTRPSTLVASSKTSLSLDQYPLKAYLPMDDGVFEELCDEPEPVVAQQFSEHHGSLQAILDRSGAARNDASCDPSATYSVFESNGRTLNLGNGRLDDAMSDDELVDFISL